LQQRLLAAIGVAMLVTCQQREIIRFNLGEAGIVSNFRLSHCNSVIGFCVFGVAVAFASPPKSPAASVLDRAKDFIEKYEKQVAPLEKQANLAWWAANTSGRDEDFKKLEAAENAVDEMLSSRTAFKELKSIVESLPENSPKLLARQIEVMHLRYLEKQVDPQLLKRITNKKGAVEKAFNRYRAKVRGKEYTASEVSRILKNSVDTKERKAVWEASKAVGQAVIDNLIELVELRNRWARELGFKNFYELQLFIGEQKLEEVLKIFDELDALTQAPFVAAKSEIDETLAKKYQLPVTQLMPWHYEDPFFQEAPTVGKIRFDDVYEKQDILKLARDFYAGLGLPIDDVIARSDLYEKKGKSPHAFCTDIDRQGDVRVLANIVPTEKWMSTMLHELGHAVYSSKFMPKEVPYVLRDASHTLTTEGLAMMVQRFSVSADWLAKLGVTVKNPEAFNAAGQRAIQHELLVFSRWGQVMFRFEKALYENPKQNLNKLWWSLVEKYQGLKAPKGRNAPDFASKIHIVTAPAYYHNYVMGQLFASQVHHAIAKEIFDEDDASKVQYVGRKDVGRFIRTKIIERGKVSDWRELTESATGEPLSAKAFAQDFQARKSQ
jgi:peptidyl-dipeptidase A